MKKIAVVEILQESFNDFTKQWKVLLGSFAIIWAIGFVGIFISGWLAGSDLAFMSWLFNIVLWVVELALSVGLIRIALDVVDHKVVKISHLWDSVSNYRLLAFYLIASIIVGISVSVGLLLLVVPGIFLAVKLQLVQYFVVDKAQSPIDAIKSSWDKTKGLFVYLLLFDVVLLVANFFGWLLLGVGLLITVPVTMVAMARLYRKLSS